MPRPCFLALAATASLVVTFGVAPAFAGASEALLAHRAVYDLVLKNSTDRSGIDAMSGRMVYEFNGSACDGYTTRFRLVTRIVTGGESRTTDQQTTTYEDLRSRQFRFDTRSFLNGEPDKEVRGSAHGTPTATEVDLTMPAARHLKLPHSEFPTEHMLEMIRHAGSAETMYQSRIFDGSEEADQAPLTSMVLGGKEKAATGEGGSGLSALRGETFWPATVAYFDDSGKGDETPSYRIAFDLYANGVTRDLTMDYGDFVLHGTLVKFEPLKQPECNKPQPGR